MNILQTNISIDLTNVQQNFWRMIQERSQFWTALCTFFEDLHPANCSILNITTLLQCLYVQDKF
jgi:hypothetical protein